MALRFLYNKSADLVTAFENPVAGSAASGYDWKTLIAGPRSTFFRMASSSTDQGIGYAHQGINNTPDYLIIARADKLLTTAGMRVRAAQRASGGSWTTLAPDLNPISSANLTGIRKQDYISAISPTSLQGVGIVCTPVSGNQTAEISKLFGATSFSFGTGVEPIFGAEFQTLAVGTYSQPLKCLEPYEVEQRFSLVWPTIPTSAVNSFLALPQIFRWPVFLYDDAQNIFDWQLEHVIIEAVQVNVLEKDISQIEVTFARLRHYD